ncbi:MAG: hypothetical protein U0736_05485 [Gemmataceae bacterium]
MPFEAYSNPFADGRAARMTSRRLVRYTYAAVEAWARDRDLPRAATRRRWSSWPDSARSCRPWRRRRGS